MAWLSIGQTNEELCNKLQENNVITSSVIIKAFKLTDRGDFVQQKYRHEAYSDRPYKRDYVHISAPHMYVTVIEALELSEGLAFLNIGSGSGYLSCLIATLLGQSGVSHGIDINSSVINHSRDCCDRWFKSFEGTINEGMVCKEGVQLVHGNCFDIDINSSVNRCLYDRIYIGAGCPAKHIPFFYQLLSENGIIVVPIDDSNELVKIRRVCGQVYTSTHITQVHFAPLVNIANLIVNDSITTFVANTPLVKLPVLSFQPKSSRFKQFPKNYQIVIKTLIYSQPVYNCSYNYCLPIHLWLEILSYCPRDWFQVIKSDKLLLEEELKAERMLRKEAEDKLRIAEREREIYRVSSNHNSNLFDLMLTCISSTRQMLVARMRSVHSSTLPQTISIPQTVISHPDDESDSSSEDAEEDHDLITEEAEELDDEIIEEIDEEIDEEIEDEIDESVYEDADDLDIDEINESDDDMNYHDTMTISYDAMPVIDLSMTTNAIA